MKQLHHSYLLKSGIYLSSKLFYSERVCQINIWSGWGFAWMRGMETYITCIRFSRDDIMAAAVERDSAPFL